jgi:hypothetical protein
MKPAMKSSDAHTSIQNTVAGMPNGATFIVNIVHREHEAVEGHFAEMRCGHFDSDDELDQNDHVAACDARDLTACRRSYEIAVSLQVADTT